MHVSILERHRDLVRKKCLCEREASERSKEKSHDHRLKPISHLFRQAEDYSSKKESRIAV